MRRPAYFSPARRRPPTSSHARAPITSTASGGKRTEAAAATQRDAFGVERQRARRLRVEAAAHAREQRRVRRRSRAPRAAAPDDDAGRRSSGSRSASDAAASSAPSTTATARSSVRPAPAPRFAAAPLDDDRRHDQDERAPRARERPLRGTRSRCRRSPCRSSRRRARRRGAPAGTAGSPIAAASPRPAAGRERSPCVRLASRLRCRGGMTIDETPRGPERRRRSPGMARPRSGARDLERYAGLFARRTQGDEVLRDARPDGGHRAAGGDLARRRAARHEHVPAEDFAALMARVAVDDSARGAPVRPDRGAGRGQGAASLR